MNNIRRKGLKDRGAALIVSLGVLTLLIVMALGTTANMLYEMRMADDSYFSTVAQYGAESGISWGIVRLRNEARTNFIDTTSEAWYYNWSGAPGTPSYNNFDGSGNGRTYTIDAGLVNIITRVYLYDCASRIYVNDMNNPNLAGILNRALTRIGAPFAGNEGNFIITERGINGPFVSISDIRRRIPATINQAKEKELRKYITTFSYVDPTTINPLDVATPYAVQTRAPININTAPIPVLAAVFEGLTLTRACPKCSGDGTINGQSNVACSACGGTGTLTITNAEAGFLAQWISTQRSGAGGPFTSWQNFYTRLKGVAPTEFDASPPNGTSAAQPVGERDADLILANCNPNPGIDMGVRDYSWGQAVGYAPKAMLIPQGTSGNRGLSAYTTELCFNSGGWYEIVAEAQIQNKATMAIEATKKYGVFAKIFDMVKQTSQADFAASASRTNVITYPENLAVTGMTAKAFDGYLTRDFKNLATDATTTLFVPLNDGQVNATISSGSNVPLATDNINAANSIFNTAGAGNSLLPSGLAVTKTKKEHLSYNAFSNLDPQNFTMEVWLKLNTDVGDANIVGAPANADRYAFQVTENDNITKWIGSPDGDASYNWYKSIIPNNGRKSVQFWFWNVWRTILGSQEWCAVGSLGTCGVDAHPNTTQWYWMQLVSQGLKNLNGSQDTKKGEWMHFTFSAADEGYWYSQYPDPDAGDAATNPWWHWNTTDPLYRKNPEAGIAGRNLFTFKAGFLDGYATIQSSKREKWFYLNGNKMTQNGIWMMDLQNYCKLGPFINDSTARIALGFNWWANGLIRNDSELNGVMRGFRISNTQKTDAQVQASFLEGVYDGTAGNIVSSKVLPAGATTTKPADALWGCCAWTQYAPAGVTETTIDVSNDQLSWIGGFGSASAGGTPLNAVLNDGINDVYYRLSFSNRGASIRNTTVFDDITFTYLPAPVIRGYHEID